MKLSVQADAGQTFDSSNQTDSSCNSYVKKEFGPRASETEAKWDVTSRVSSVNTVPLDVRNISC